MMWMRCWKQLKQLQFQKDGKFYMCCLSILLSMVPSRVQDPMGMHGVRLEVYAHIIMGSVSSVQNLINCCQSAGVQVNDIILEQLASADAVLSEDERELGVGVIDIGGGTSDVAFYKNSAVRHTMVLPVAGNHVTNDIAIGLRIMKSEAEKIKKRYGFAISSLVET